MIPLYSRVRVVTDRLVAEGIERDQTGYVIEDYGGGYYEVEFSRHSDGTTIWLGAMSETELELVPERPPQE